MKIQNIIIPDVKFPEKEMFFRTSGKIATTSSGISFTKGSSAVFNSYFNLFHISEWEKITGKETFLLTVNVKGKVQVDLFGFCSSQGMSSINEQELPEILLETQVGDNQNLSTLTFEFSSDRNVDFVYFKITALDECAQFVDGWYAAEKPEACNDVRLALVFCTYKREKYLYHNVEEILKYIDLHEELKNRIHLYIIDNGNSIDKEQIKSEHVTLFPNKNTGGSGGFCRGIIEVLRSGKGYSHVLLMDDDVEVFGESFFRTMSLLNLREKKYQDIFINGAMFRLDNKNIQFESLADWRHFYFKPLRAGLDMNNVEDICLYNYLDKTKKLYAGWWYCCIPLHLLDENDLPFPFFIRKDDVEYALRHKARFVNLNGICIWHEAFDKKKNPVMDYYLDLRNDLILNTLMARPGKAFIFNVLLSLRFMIKLLFQYDYEDTRVSREAMLDFLAGPEILFRDQQEVIKRVNSFKEKLTDLNSEEFQRQNDVNSEKKVSLIRKLVMIASFNGHFVPQIFFRKNAVAAYGAGRDYHTWFLAREVVFVDKDNFTFVQRTIDFKKFLSLLLSFIAIVVKYFFRHRRLAREYQKSYPEFTSIEFWKRYLEIE